MALRPVDAAPVLDLYAATIARATSRDTIPQAGWDGVRVFIPLSQRIKVKNSGEFERAAHGCAAGAWSPRTSRSAPASSS